MKVSLVVVFALTVQLSFAQQAVPQTTGTARAQPSRFIGTWVLDAAKSTFGSGQRLASQIRTYEAFGDGQKSTIESVDAAGSRAKYGYAARFDGRYYPMTGTGIPNGADAITIARVDANTIAATLQKAGQEVMEAKLSVSGDGKILTIERTGTTNAVLVFNRQPAPQRRSRNR